MTHLVQYLLFNGVMTPWDFSKLFYWVCLYVSIIKMPYLYHFWSDIDGINTVGNHTRRFILIPEAVSCQSKKLNAT